MTTVGRRARPVLAVGVAALTLAVPALAGQQVKSFFSPNGNIHCQLAAGGEHGTTVAYCQSFVRARSVTLYPNGKTFVCRGEKCLANRPLDEFKLNHGQSVTVGPFRCHSSVAGMSCVVRRTGEGFLISKKGVARTRRV